jgi:hypothetical protein
LFADDSLLFVKATDEGATEVVELLDKYCNASGQRINLDKSLVFFNKGCPEGRRQAVKTILNVPNETLNEKYLDMPSDIRRSINGAFKYLKDRIWKRIQGWLEQLLAAGGMEVLIKSVAQAIPTLCPASNYHRVYVRPSMQCFEASGGAARRAKENQVGSLGRPCVPQNI